ncbi:MAG: DUF1153 domain-containing protein [Alphaproteobacteria bacterium]
MAAPLSVAGQRVATLAKLPTHHAIRWTALRKAAVVLSVRERLLGRDEALAIYRLSEEELTAWSAAYAAFGLAGLETAALARADHRIADGSGPVPDVRRSAMREPPQAPRDHNEETTRFFGGGPDGSRRDTGSTAREALGGASLDHPSEG